MMNVKNATKGYREAAQMREEEDETIRNAAEALCLAFDIDVESPDSETYREHAYWLALAMQVYTDRNPETHDAWRGPGWLGNLLALHGKVLRLMNSLYWVRPATLARSEKPLDNAMDALNYAVFFARCYDEGDERGGPQSLRA